MSDKNTYTGRPIKFRAWNGKEMTDKIAIAGNGHKTTWDEGDSLLGPMLRSVDWPVMQHVGHQLGGTDLYEGDVVRIAESDDEFGGDCVVAWIGGLDGFMLIDIPSGEYARYLSGGEAAILPDRLLENYPELYKDGPHKIVGNIFSNPELIPHDPT